MKTGERVPNKKLRIITGLCLVVAALVLLSNPFPSTSTATEQLYIGRGDITNVVLTWSATGVLQYSPSIAPTGLWSELPLASSPYLSPMTNTAGFFRLRVNPPPTNFAYHYVAPTFTISIGDPAPSACGCVSPDGPTSAGGAIPGIAQANGMGSVALATGELVQHAIDLQIPGRGFDWRLERHYRSGVSYDGPAGHNWEFNYNRRLFVEADGDVLRMDGAGRADRYVLTNGVYQTPGGFYTRLTRNIGDGTFLERDRHGMTYSYSATNLTGIAHLTRIADRNGNQMTFQYNVYGQLIYVVDTLGRTITHNYDAAGRLTNVVDFAGRQLRFTYDGNGDLVAVTSPAVTGTPNGNDFPLGKTTYYSYSSGYADPRFNHNLLSVTAPNEVAVSGPARLIAQYDTSLVSSNADRVVALTLGGTNASGIAAGGTIRYAYTNFNAVASNDFTTAVSQNTVIDRNGNTNDFRFNQIGNIVRARQYTRGLRGTDPAYFEISSQFNKDGEMTSRTNPEGDSVTYAFNTGNADRLQQGNLLSVTNFPGARGGDQTQLAVSYTYETNFNFVATFTDARTNTTSYAYDNKGNRTNTVYGIPSVVEGFEYNSSGQMTAHVLPDNGSSHRRRDALTYYSSGSQNGYLQQQIVDSGGLNLTTSYEYDTAGNVTRMTDPLGNDTLYVVNQLNQIVRTSSRAVSTTNGLVRYQTDFSYDANGNDKTDTENIDENGIIASPPSFATTNVWDILNHPLLTAQQVGTNSYVTTGYQYDANGNRALVRSGVATSGLQTNNVVQTLYDERNLVFQVKRAPGDPAQSTIQYDYDANGNVVRISQGTESSPRITTYAYDGFNRRTGTTDPMDNVHITHYDANGNSSDSRVDGELADVSGSTNNVRLAETTYSYDALNRLTQTDLAIFDPAGGTNLAGGHAISTTIYSASSQVLQTIDANNHTNSTAYDNANRPSVATDARGNTKSYDYDANGRVTTISRVDKSDLGMPNRTFNTYDTYDNVDRLIREVDNAGNTNSYAYDSRNNLMKVTDGRGDLTRYTYDGLGRQTATTRSLAGGGSILTRQTWDDNSRLTGQTDNNANTTAYGYDPLNRLTGTVFADGTTNSATYDVHDNPTVATDANGSQVTTTYDLGNRPTGRTITRGSGVQGTTSENYQYDGLSRIASAANNDTVVTRGYDSRARILRETLQVSSSGGPTQTVASTFDRVGNRLSYAYPGGRVINRTYDDLNRLQVVTNSTGLIARYYYLGSSRVERRDYGNGTRAAYGYDSVRRMTNSLQTVISGGTNIDSRAYAWDASDNKTAMNNLLAPAQDSKTFSYDSANRLVQSTPVAGVTNTYVLDGVGNRLSVTGENAGVYSMSAAVPPADFQMNQYTATAFDSRTNDANGNLVNAGSQQFYYDYRNRLVAAWSGGTNTLSAKYDCFGRRVEKASLATTNRYYYCGWREFEEQSVSNTTVATYAWADDVHTENIDEDGVMGGDIDELLTMDRGGQRYYYHADDLNSVRKVTDAGGNVVEQYRYGDYGQPSFYDGSGTSLTNSAIGNYTLFTGRRYDPETGLYYYRTRYLDPLAGRFTSRDAIGIWGDETELGNGCSYVGNSPGTRRDPYGRESNATYRGIEGSTQSCTRCYCSKDSLGNCQVRDEDDGSVFALCSDCTETCGMVSYTPTRECQSNPYAYGCPCTLPNPPPSCGFLAIRMASTASAIAYQSMSLRGDSPEGCDPPCPEGSACLLVPWETSPHCYTPIDPDKDWPTPGGPRPHMLISGANSPVPPSRSTAQSRHLWGYLGPHVNGR